MQSEVLRHGQRTCTIRHSKSQKQTYLTSMLLEIRSLRILCMISTVMCKTTKLISKHWRKTAVSLDNLHFSIIPATAAIITTNMILNVIRLTSSAVCEFLVVVLESCLWDLSRSFSTSLKTKHTVTKIVQQETRPLGERHSSKYICLCIFAHS